MHPYKLMAIAWVVVIIWITFVIYSNRKIHPKALFLLFFAEFWERFSYYGMRALLVLYMVKSLDYTEPGAYGVYAAYGAMVYATPILGGLIANKLFGYQKAIIWGGILMAAGHFAMAFEPLFFVALSLLILGNGFFKPNISSFISEFYEKDDPRKDGAYTLFYMGINAGAFLTPLTCGVVGEISGWHYGFGLAGVGMVLGLVVFWWAGLKGIFEDKGGPTNPKVLYGYSIPVFKHVDQDGNAKGKTLLPINNEWLIYLATLLFVPLVMILIKHNDTLDVLLGILGVSMLSYLVWSGWQYEDRADGQRLYVIVVLLLFTTMFWTFFELAGSAVNLFTDKNVDRVIGGSEIPTSAFQSINPLFIILLAPVFSGLWRFLRNRNLEPSSPVKFAFGLLLLGAGFMGFKLGAGFAVNGMVPVIFLVLAYFLQTLGELCLSPVGLSLVTKLSPAKIVGFVMGIWFLSSSIAHQAGKFIANMTASSDSGVATKLLSAADALPIYTEVFTNVGYVALAAGVLLLLLSPIIKKWMHGIN